MKGAGKILIIIQFKGGYNFCDTVKSTVKGGLVIAFHP